MSHPPLHPSLEPLSWLLGDWSGEGRGEYPTIEPFAWKDQTRFWHVGKPGILYEQRTKDAATGEPRHAESGFLRPGAEPDSVELIVAHNTGHAEMAAGSLTGTRLEFESTVLEGTPTAKDVGALHRVFELDGDVLRVSLAMAAVGQPMTHHLASELHRP